MKGKRENDQRHWTETLQPEDYEHAAHQAGAAHRDGHDTVRKAKSIEKGGTM